MNSRNEPCENAGLIVPLSCPAIRTNEGPRWVLEMRSCQENAISPSVFLANDYAATWRCAVSTPGNLAPTCSSFISGIGGRALFGMSIHLIELIDIEIGQTLPLTGLIGSPCFFRGFFTRYIIYQLSTRRLWPALSLLWGSFTSLPDRPTIIYRSTWWSLDGEVSIYHYREAKPSLSRLQSPFSSCLLHRRARKHSCQCLSIDLAPLSMLSRKKLLSTVCGIILWKSTSCLSTVTVSVERAKQKLLQALAK